MTRENFGKTNFVKNQFGQNFFIYFLSFFPICDLTFQLDLNELLLKLNQPVVVVVRTLIVGSLVVQTYSKDQNC